GIAGGGRRAVPHAAAPARLRQQAWGDGPPASLRAEPLVRGHVADSASGTASGLVLSPVWRGRQHALGARAARALGRGGALACSADAGSVRGRWLCADPRVGGTRPVP